MGRHQPVATGRIRPILLKKSVMDSTTEKYAFEIEIFTLSSGFRVQISRSGAQKRRFQPSVCGQSGRTDFFNRIGQKQSFDGPSAVHLRASLLPKWVYVVTIFYSQFIHDKAKTGDTKNHPNGEGSNGFLGSEGW